MKLIKSFVDKAKPPADKDQVFYRDHLRGFALRVTVKGAKSFVIETSIGNLVRLTDYLLSCMGISDSTRICLKLLGRAPI